MRSLSRSDSAYAATKDARAVQELAGHQSLRTMQLYTKISDVSKTAAVRGLPQLKGA